MCIESNLLLHSFNLTFLQPETKWVYLLPETVQNLFLSQLLQEFNFGLRQIQSSITGQSQITTTLQKRKNKTNLFSTLLPMAAIDDYFVIQLMYQLLKW